jgi:hypothetical protein
MRYQVKVLAYRSTNRSDHYPWTIGSMVGWSLNIPQGRLFYLALAVDDGMAVHTGEHKVPLFVPAMVLKASEWASCQQ